MPSKRILVLGGAGSIGSELVRQLTPNHEVYIFDLDETRMFDLVEELGIKGRIGDIRKKEVLASVFLELQPQIVFNCAALKHVTPSAWTPREYVQTNVTGTLNILELCREYAIPRFINISTDKAVNSQSVMGWSKRGTELFTKIYGYNSVRFGNVRGSRGSVETIWEKQFKTGKPLTITDLMMTRYMMTIPEAVELVVEASRMPQDGRIVVLDMGEPRKIIDLKNELYGEDYPVKVIGIRPGETLKEELMTEEEKKKAIKIGKFWVIK